MTTPSESPRPALTELARTKIHLALGLFASCIKSGEPWTRHCESAKADAFDALSALVALATGGAADTARLQDARDVVEDALLAMREPMTLKDARAGRDVLTKAYNAWQFARAARSLTPERPADASQPGAAP